jgi:hypothetical protein
MQGGLQPLVSLLLLLLHLLLLLLALLLTHCLGMQDQTMPSQVALSDLNL